jgi:hypothetical protein
LIAGDVSGDRHGAALAHALRKVAPDVQLRAAGGAALRAAGVEVCVDTTSTSVIGAVEAVRRWRALRARYRAVQRAIEAAQPHVVVLVDTEALLLPIPACGCGVRTCRWCCSAAGVDVGPLAAALGAADGAPGGVGVRARGGALYRDAGVDAVGQAIPCATWSRRLPIRRAAVPRRRPRSWDVRSWR